MKNLHLRPTDKPSRLSILNSGKLNFGAEAMSSSNSKLQHIYITSDEEIKKGDWIYGLFNGGVILRSEFNIPKHTQYYLEFGLKIILTTDQDLIADGVQVVDNEFLEWFVKNPSCESVKYVGDDCYYEIIIPKEEPKQETLDFISKELDIERKRVHKQETLEEAALRLYPKFSHDPYNPLEDVLEDEREIFIEGAEWQAERMYSEEDMKSAYFSAIESTGEGWNGEYAEGNNPNIEDKFSEEFKEWFEQFKKKGGDK
jgi:hypothetical protein